MNFPDNLKYTKEHEWVRIEGNEAFVGITWYAQKELGDIVFVEIETEGETIEKDEPFGTVEAVKTVSDLFMPLTGEVLEVNEAIRNTHELVNKDPYGQGWMVRVKLQNPAEVDGLLSADEYKKLVS